MTIRSTLQRRLLALLALAVCSSLAQAQLAATVAPPARIGTAVQGSVLKTVNVADQAACQAACTQTPGCTGYNLAPRGTDPKGGNCSLHGGALNDIAAPGVVSCRMPCAAAPALTKTLPARPLPNTILRDAGALKAPAVPTPPPAPRPLLMAPAPVIVGTVKPAPAPAPAPAPLAKTTAPVQPARSAIAGWEVAAGPWVQIAALSSATATAQCPGAKIALSAAYEAEPNQGDAAFGIEVRGAMPQGNHARVFVRNANAFVAARLRATAVCVNPIAGLRAVDTASGVMNQNTNPYFYSDPGCTPAERLVGGGAMASIDVNLYANGPAINSRGRQDGVTRWTVTSQFASPLAAAQNASARALCAPEHLVDGWEYVEAPEASLGARSRTTVVTRCSAGDKRVLAAGFDATATAAANFIAPVLLISGADAGAASAQLLNRNTIGGADSLRAKLGAVCARAP